MTAKTDEQHLTELRRWIAAELRSEILLRRLGGDTDGRGIQSWMLAALGAALSFEMLDASKDVRDKVLDSIERSMLLKRGV